VIHHLLLIRKRDDLSEDDNRRFEAAVDALSEIEGVLDLTWGPDFSGRAKGYTHAAVLRFENRDSLAMYAGDAIHLRTVDILNELAPERLVLDYETGTSIISAP
jgi:Stress responsive A/B Barrel Domain